MQVTNILVPLLAVTVSAQTVYLIRHGEKPADGGNGLTIQGQQRAQCLRTVFGASSGYNIGYILAQQPKSNGKRTRPLMTVQPLATDLGLTVDTSCDRDDAACVVNLVNGYTGSGNVLICWEHDNLSVIAEALGDKTPPTYPDESETLPITVDVASHLHILDDGTIKRASRNFGTPWIQNQRVVTVQTPEFVLIYKNLKTMENEHKRKAGFPELAFLLQQGPETSIYRRFDELAARNLVYLEAELQLLSQELYSTEAATDRTEPYVIETKTHEMVFGPNVGWRGLEDTSRSWEAILLQSQRVASDQHERSVVQDMEIESVRTPGHNTNKLELILRIRTVLREYEEAIIRRNQILQTRDPDSVVFHKFYSWFNGKEPLEGSGRDLLERGNDFLSLGSGSNFNLLTRMVCVLVDSLTKRAVLLRRFMLSDIDANPERWDYLYKPIFWKQLVQSYVGVAAALQLFFPVITMVYVSRVVVRLSLVILWTIMFAFMAASVTTASGEQILSGSIAYAGFLAIFVKGNLTSTD